MGSRCVVWWRAALTMHAFQRQDWDSLFGHLNPATAPSEPGSVSVMGSHAAAVEKQHSSVREGGLLAEAQLVELNDSHSGAVIDQLFQEADADRDGR